MKNLRYINLGIVDPVYAISCWEFIKTGIETPTLIVSLLDKPSLIITNINNKLDYFLNMNNIPSDLCISKLYTDTKCDFLTGNIILANAGSIIHSFHVPNNNKNWYKDVALTIGRVFRKENVPYYTYNSFTEYMIDEKKIGGTINYNYGDWSVYGGVVASSFNYKLFDNMIKQEFFSGGIKKITGSHSYSVSTTRELLSGIEEYGINKTSDIPDKYAQNFCDINNLTLIKDVFTKNEIKFLNNLSMSLRNNNDWIYNNIHP